MRYLKIYYCILWIGVFAQNASAVGSDSPQLATTTTTTTACVAQISASGDQEALQKVLQDEERAWALSCDGGGLKGLFAAGVLWAFEARLTAFMLRELQQEGLWPTGGGGDGLDAPLVRLVAEYFDLVSGTSTGAIITAGTTTPSSESVNMGLPSSTQKLFELYWIQFPDISLSLFEKFISKVKRVGGVFSKSVTEEEPNYNIFRPGKGTQYSAEGIEEVLKHFLSETHRLSDAVFRIPVLINTYDQGNQVKNKDNRMLTLGRRSIGFLTENNWFVWEACRASSAAPKYFPSYKRTKDGNDEWYSDGGLGNNHPGLTAYTGVRETYPEKRLEEGGLRPAIVSIGTGIFIEDMRFLRTMGTASAVWNLPQFVGGCIDAASSSTASLLESLDLTNALEYIRLQMRLQKDLALDSKACRETIGPILRERLGLAELSDLPREINTKYFLDNPYHVFPYEDFEALYKRFEKRCAHRLERLKIFLRKAREQEAYDFSQETLRREVHERVQHHALAIFFKHLATQGNNWGAIRILNLSGGLDARYLENHKRFLVLMDYLRNSQYLGRLEELDLSENCLSQIKHTKPDRPHGEKLLLDQLAVLLKTQTTGHHLNLRVLNLANNHLDLESYEKDLNKFLMNWIRRERSRFKQCILKGNKVNMVSLLGALDDPTAEAIWQAERLPVEEPPMLEVGPQDELYPVMERLRRELSCIGIVLIEDPVECNEPQDTL